jgi:adenylate cyclase
MIARSLGPSRPPLAAGPSGRIDSWKEIAAYLKRGARTVQRWEREAGLPVHRLRHDRPGSVYAYKSEVDAWWLSRRSTLEKELAANQPSEFSISILPFEDMSREKDQQYFCDGIAEEITSALSTIQGLRISSGAPSARAETLLTGSVRKSGERLRISVQLANAERGFQMWSEIYDRTLGDVFAIQEEIARRVAGSLRITFTRGEATAAAPEAHDLYLRGRQYYYRYGPLDIECAIQLFTQAVQRAPEFAMAYAGLADCWSYLYLYVECSDTVRDQAEWASALAAELDPQSAPAQTSRGLAISLHRRNREAEQAFECAVRLDPCLFDAHYHFAAHCFVTGQLEKARFHYDCAARCRPDDYQSPLLMARIYDDLRRTEEGRGARLRGIQLAEERLKLHPDDTRAVYLAANGMAALGEGGRALEWADRAAAMRPQDSLLLYYTACTHSLLRNCELAITLLEKSVRNGLRQKAWYEGDSSLDLLRSHPRFHGLVASLEDAASFGDQRTSGVPCT